MASQDEPVALVHILLDVLAALSEDSLAIFLEIFDSSEELVSKLLAAHTLWDVFHSLYTARPLRTKTIGCRKTDMDRTLTPISFSVIGLDLAS